MIQPIPEPIRLAKAAGHPIFGSPYDANWIVLRNPAAPLDTFDGVSTLSWTEPGGAWQTVTIRAATRPGTGYLRAPMNANGTAVVIPGRHPLSHAPGLHKGTPALVQVRRVRVHRDADRDLVLDPSTAAWDDATGVNHHECSDPRWLAGCIGSPRAELAVLLAAFRRLQGLRAQGAVSLVLLEVS